MKKLVNDLNEANDFSFVQKTICPRTELVLYTTNAEEKLTVLRSYGTCINCKTSYHLSEIHQPVGSVSPNYPIVYEGVWCKACWSFAKDKEIVDEEPCF